MPRKKPARPAPPARPVSWWNRPAARSLAISIGLAAITWFVYASVRGFEFVNWDDPSYLTDNPNLVGGLTWQSARWALTTGYTPYWHPMTWLSHLLDVQLFGFDAGPHHVTSVLLHVANTLLVFEGLRRLTGAMWRSAFVAAVFATHPLHVESVAWLAERKDVLSTFFLLLTIWAYAAYARRPGAGRYLATVGLFGLALMSKPMVVTLPFLLLLMDFWPLQRAGLAAGQRSAWRALVVEKLPLVVLALGVSISTFVIQRRVGAVAGLGALPWTFRLANATVAYVVYLQKTIWPVHLAPFYPMHDLSSGAVLTAALALVAVTAAAIACRRRAPYVLAGWLWFVLSIAPVAGLVQAGEQALADRFAYVALIGPFVIVAWGAADVIGRLRVARVLLPAAAIVVVAACATAAKAQVAHWSDSVTLWRHAIAVIPDNYTAYEKLGDALRDRGDLAEAQASYTQALAAAPTSSAEYHAVIHNDLGLVLMRLDKPDDAIAHFSTAVQFNAAFAEAQTNLGNALASVGRLTEAVDHFREAVRIEPDRTEAAIGLGGTLLRLARPGDARPYFEAALRLDPNLAEAHNGMGAALAMQGDEAGALAQYSTALQLKPELATAHFNLAVLLIKQGKLDDGRAELETTLRLDPQFQPARQAIEAIRARGRSGGGSQ